MALDLHCFLVQFRDQHLMFSMMLLQRARVYGLQKEDISNAERMRDRSHKRQASDAEQLAMTFLASRRILRHKKSWVMAEGANRTIELLESDRFEICTTHR